MRSVSVKLFVLTLPLLIHALPAIEPYRRSSHTTTIDKDDDVLLFDGLGYPGAEGETFVNLQAFVYPRGADRPGGLVSGFVSTLIKMISSVVTTRLDPTIPPDRLKMFAISGESGKNIVVNVEGCSKPAQLTKTDRGLVVRQASVGKCPKNKRELMATVKLSAGDTKQIRSTIFNSPSDGFGVISDIDDTIRNSHVLNKLQLLKSTFGEPPYPVPGMPELYTSLSRSLKAPLFVYISGSPFQLYPFLQGFLGSTFPASKGPIFLRNFTASSAASLMNMAKTGNIKEHKLAMIDRIHGMYPEKQFLAIGDSGELDPETYGESYRQYNTEGRTFIHCIWIRRVDGAKNSEERFAKAFQGVPKGKWRVFSDAEILSVLSIVNVAGGAC